MRQPPAGSSPVICTTELRFHPVNESIIEAQTYLYYIQTPLSRPSEGVWVPFNEQTEQSLLADFKRLWATSFLDNLWIETIDVPFANGVMGKHVIYHMEERPRVKIVDYTGSTKVERTKVDEKMKELGISLRLDSFLDQSVVKRVQGIVQRSDGREGLRVRRGDADRRAAAGRAQAGQGRVRRQGRPAGQGPRRSTSTATSRSSDGALGRR